MKDIGIYLCAEVGVSWDTKPRLKRLIKDCLEAGADAVKLQMFNEETIKDYPPALRERLTPMILTSADLNELSVFVHANGGELVVTPMYLGAMDILKKLKPFPVDGFKVRATDFTNLPLLKEVIGKAGDVPVYVSVPYDEFGNTRNVQDGTYQTLWSSNVYSVFCRPEYPPKLGTMGLYHSLNFNGVSLHSKDWTVHAIACAFHIGHEEIRPHEHIKRYYCEVHVMPEPGRSVEVNVDKDEAGRIYTIPGDEYEHPLDEAVSLRAEDLAKLAKAIKTMETVIG